MDRNLCENESVGARALGVVCALALACIGLADPITIRMMGRSQGVPPPEATDPRSLARRAIFDEFHRRNPDIEVVNAGGLELTGDRAEAGLLMSLAGDTAPDVFYVNFRSYFSYVDQGFCRPLDDFLTREQDAFNRAHPKILEVLKSGDGSVYAAPFYQVAQALYYRKDHFREAGLDPNRPPRTWDEFIEYGRRLTESKKGRKGFVFAGGAGGKAYWWTNFVWQAGGDVLAPAERGYSKSVIATPEAALALDFFRRLTLEKWSRDGQDYGPIAGISSNHSQDIADGKVSMWFAYTNDISLSISDLNPSLLGISAMPAGPAGSRNEINAGMWAINAQVKDPKKLEACWKFIKFFVSQDAAKVSAQRFVEFGMANLVNPVLLEEIGYHDLAASVDPALVEANKNLFERGKPEPYGRNSQQVYVVLDAALDRAMQEPKTPAINILNDVSKEMDQKLLGYTPEDVLAKQRRAAGFVLAAVVMSACLAAWVGVSRARRTVSLVENRLPAGSDRRRVLRFIAFCIAPAVLSLILWAYWPLVNGLVIAFQDYRIMQGARWVGLDNFIAVFSQPVFWKSLVNSFVYVGLTILIGFFLPIGLALALDEIPKFKVLFRTLFYLPAMTSPIVIAFLWRQLYDSTEAGLLNSLLAPIIGFINQTLHLAWPTTYNWLGDPKLAMFSVVLPGIWAGAGPGSILYLAALKNVPEERYEAADLDGASWLQKIRWITLPSLAPLILINLLGTFIGGFKAMESFLVLPGGGPLYATHTIGLEVWTNAFLFLKFGYATAAAWVMGAILIGFTLIQLRHLTRMKFTTAKS